ncbi:MAG: alpha-glucuronidase [Treponema sp.]|nr:alpha-glucuronidase [Treponema sp.]
MIKVNKCWLSMNACYSDVDIPKLIYFNEKSLVAKQALNEFCVGIKKLLSNEYCSKIQKKGDLNKDFLLLGTIDNIIKSNSIKNIFFKKTDMNLLKKDGFIIKISGKKILIAGQNDNGLLYGVFRFLSLFEHGQIKNNFKLIDCPVSPLRMINHWDNLDGTIERGYAGRSLFFNNGYFSYDQKRIEDYARLLASVGINRISLNNVNVRQNAKLLITEKYLKEYAKLAAIFRKFAIKLLLSINFGAPFSLGGLATADPLDPAVLKWWKDRAAIIYKYIPDLAGFIVKADSEGEPGPFQYNRTHADGANMLADAVKPFGGEIIWRCFVYNCKQDWRDHSFDRACAAYNHFKPLDGKFNDNVILQIKFGPYDFQVREPVSPLFGVLKNTRHVMELQITQEYTGHQIDLCFLPSVWEDILNFDTFNGEEKSRIKNLIKPYKQGYSNIEGFAAVANTGLDNNWTGHTLAQANLYGYGRMVWNPYLSAEEIVKEWSALTFDRQEAVQKIEKILLRSYSAYEKYTSPFGVCFMVTPNTHYGPNIEGYEFSKWGTYHRSDANAIGIDRTQTGTGYTQQYSQKNAVIFADPSSCPENLILFFHRLRYDYKMKNGQTLLQNIYDTHFEGYEEVQKMADEWKSLKDIIDTGIYESVLSRFERQLENAREWRDQINTYFFRKTGIADEKGRKIYE